MSSNQRIICIAVDASTHSKGAFEYYMSNIYRQGDLVVICHIPEVPHLPTFSLRHGLSPPIEEWQKALTDQIDKVRKLEEDYEAELISRKLPHKIIASDFDKLSYKLKFDQMKNPGEGIIAISESENASLVIMGTRGLDRIRRTLLGSVSDYVVRHSKIPVLVCPNHAPTGGDGATSAGVPSPMS